MNNPCCTIQMTTIRKRYLYEILIEDHAETILQARLDGRTLAQLAVQFGVALPTMANSLREIEYAAAGEFAPEKCIEIYNLYNPARHGKGFDMTYTKRGRKSNRARVYTRNVAKDFGLSYELFALVIERAQEHIADTFQVDVSQGTAPLLAKLRSQEIHIKRLKTRVRNLQS